MWKITGLDYETAAFANAEARTAAGVDPVLWAKWKERGLALPSRTVKGGGGQYAPKKIFEFRLMNVVTRDTAIPVSEAQKIAQLAAEGSWNIRELAATPGHWRSAVLRDSPPPADVFLIFSKTTKGWTYEQSISSPSADSFKNSGSLVLAVARELNAVSKYCWDILEGPPSKAK